jgi:O-antigen/teichoic acid export membrane protein
MSSTPPDASPEGGRVKRVASTSVALFASQVILAIGGVVSARALGPDGKGVVTAVVAWAQILPWISLAGVHTAMSVRVAESRVDLRPVLGNALTYSAAIGGTVAVAAILIIPSLLSRLGGDAETIAVWALAGMPVGILAEILLAVNLALGRTRLFSLARICGSTVTLVIILALAAADRLSPGGVIIAIVSGSVVSMGVAGYGFPWLRAAVDLRTLVHDLRFGVKAHTTTVLGLANVRLDLLLMSALVPAAQIGYYGVANNLMIPVVTIAGAAASLLTPEVARLRAARDETRHVHRRQIALIRREARRYLLVSLAGGVALGAASPLLIPFVFTSAFDPAVVLVWILIPGFIANAYSWVVEAGVVGMRRAWVSNASEATGLVITVVLLPLLLPPYEAVGAAVTSTAAYLGSALAAVVCMRILARRMEQGRERGPAEPPEVSLAAVPPE